MKLICEGMDLSNAVFKVIRAISNKVANPILEGIKMTAKGDNLTLMATDLEISIKKTIRAEVFEEGDLLVKGKLFSELIKKLENEQIELSSEEDNELKIKYGESEGKLKCLNIEEFPQFEGGMSDKTVTMVQKDFSDMINKTAFACSIDNSRPILKGCKLEVEENFLVCVALDGFRLAVCKKPVKQSSGSFTAIVPARALQEIARLVDDEDEVITLVFLNNRISVEVNSTALTAQLLEGEYINYKQIVPTEFLSILRVNKEQFLDSIERAAIVAKDIKNIVKLDIKDETMNISAITEVGNVNENIMINLEGKDVLIAFNSKYLTDILRVITDEFIHIYLNSSIAPCVIKSFSGDEYLYLLLPIRINK